MLSVPLGPFGGGRVAVAARDGLPMVTDAGEQGPPLATRRMSGYRRSAAGRFPDPGDVEDRIGLAEPFEGQIHPEGQFRLAEERLDEFGLSAAEARGLPRVEPGLPGDLAIADTGVHIDEALRAKDPIARSP